MRRGGEMGMRGMMRDGPALVRVFILVDTVVFNPVPPWDSDPYKRRSKPLPSPPTCLAMNSFWTSTKPFTAARGGGGPEKICEGSHYEQIFRRLGLELPQNRMWPAPLKKEILHECTLPKRCQSLN